MLQGSGRHANSNSAFEDAGIARLCSGVGADEAGTGFWIRLQSQGRDHGDRVLGDLKSSWGSGVLVRSQRGWDGVLDQIPEPTGLRVGITGIQFRRRISGINVGTVLRTVRRTEDCYKATILTTGRAQRCAKARRCTRRCTRWGLNQGRGSHTGINSSPKAMIQTATGDWFEDGAQSGAQDGAHNDERDGGFETDRSINKFFVWVFVSGGDERLRPFPLRGRGRGFEEGSGQHSKQPFGGPDRGINSRTRGSGFGDDEVWGDGRLKNGSG
jgi:hypothetical protein